MNYAHILPDGTRKEFNTEAAYNAYMTANHQDPPELIARQMAIGEKERRVAFGTKIVDNYRADNDVLGFDALPRPERKAINNKLRKVFNEMKDGYLKDAIEEIRETVNADFDGVYVRKSRYLKLRNEIEEFLGIPKSKAFNE